MGSIGDFFKKIGEKAIEAITKKVVESEEKVFNLLNDLSEKLGGSSYDSNSPDAMAGVDKELSDFRKSIDKLATELEKQCMETIGELFNGLKKKTKDRFPDLVSIIDGKQKDAEEKLKGTIMKYVKEHLSKNDSDFLIVLNMPPGEDKQSALDKQSSKILEKAESFFCKCLSEQVKDIQKEFEYRLNSRLNEQERVVQERISFLERIEKQKKEGYVDKNRIENECIPIMDAAECIKVLLENER